MTCLRRIFACGAFFSREILPAANFFSKKILSVEHLISVYGLVYQFIGIKTHLNSKIQ